MYLIFTVLGYVGALLTAIYTFRLIFRVLPGKPCKEAQELIDTGHLAHGHPFNPATGEEEDTDVGFPGAEHHIAEQSAPMRIAMGVLAFLALFAGLVQVPGVDETITKFLDPVFADSPLATIVPSVGASWTGLAIGAAISLAGIGIAYWVYVLRPGTSAALIRRLRPLHTFLVNKWYFDEAIDILVVRPALAIGRFANRTFERVVVDGLISGAEDVVGGGGRVVRDRAERLRARLRAAAGRRLRRPRPLLPARQLMTNVAALDTARLRPRRLPAAEALGRLVGDARGPGHARPGDRAAGRLRRRRQGPPGHRRRPLDPRPRRRLQPRRRRAQRLPDPADRGALDRRHRLRRLPRAGAPPPLLPDDGAGGDRDPGLLPRPGPAPLRPLLRPDAGPVLLPLRRLGKRPRGRPDRGGGDPEDDRLHADRLAADAGRRDRDGDPLRARRADQLLDRRPRAAPARRRQPALDLLVLRRRLPGQDAGLPPARLDAGRLPGGAAAGAGGLLRGARQGRRLRLPADRPAALPERRRSSSRRCSW